MDMQYPVAATVCWVIDGFLQLILVIVIGFAIRTKDIDYSTWLICSVLNPMLCIPMSCALAITPKNELWRKYYGLICSLILRVIFLSAAIVIFILFEQTQTPLFFGANIVSFIISTAMLIMTVTVLFYMIHGKIPSLRFP